MPVRVPPLDDENDIWSALPLVMVRAAALPREAFPRLQPAHRENLLSSLWNQPALAAAVRLANPLVAEHIDRHLGGDVAPAGKQRRLENTLVSYANRMTSRATPFGLFAGVGFTTWSEPTVVPTEPEVAASRRLVRPSEYAIAKEIGALEASGDDLSLEVETNPTHQLRHGRIYFHAPVGVRRSVRQSAVLEDLVEFACRPRTLRDVIVRAQELSAPEPIALARRLLTAGLLISSLRTCAPHPLPSDMLKRKAVAQGRADKLQTAELAMTFPSHAAPDDLRRTLASALPILQRVAAAQPSDSSLDAYARHFAERFGHEEAPLLDVVDSSVGLGSLPPVDYSAAGETTHRHDALCRLVLGRAARNGGLQASIEASDVADIAVADNQRVGSVDVFVRLVADGHPDGRWVIGPRGVVAPGGRAFARFGHLDARVDEHIHAAVHGDIQAHRNIHFVTIDHWQDSMRDLATGCAPGDGLLIWSSAASTSTANTLLRPSELLVGHCDGRLFLRSRLDGALVVARPHHLVDTADAPAAIDLAHRVSTGASVTPNWSWALAAQFLPMLPRVCIGDLVVSPARWRLDLTANSTGAVAHWREESGVPRFVEAGLHDQRLLLDLDSEVHRELLSREWQHGLRWVEESLCAPRPPAVFRGRTSEFVVTMIESRVPSRPEPASRPAQVERDSASSVTNPVRLPGDGWWSFHVRPTEDGTDRVLAAVDQYAARRDVVWFFARLDYPEEHLRVRAHGEQFQVSEFCALLRLLARRDALIDFTIQPYHREIQRYGGEAQLAQCEELFCADSSLAAECLPLFDRLRSAGIDPVALAAVVTQLYLTSLGLVDSATDEVLAIMMDRSLGEPTPIRARRSENEVSALLPLLIANPDAPATSWIAELTASYASPLGYNLTSADPEIVRSLVHMHLNRRAIMPADERDGAAALWAVRQRIARRHDPWRTWD